MKQFIVLLIFAIALQAGASEQPAFYRKFTEKVRSEGVFKIPMPANGDLQFNYKFMWDTPIYKEPRLADVPVAAGASEFFRSFWDRIAVKDGSVLKLGDEEIPVTCIYISGQDNRYSKTSTLFPDYVIRVYIVANDFSCVGPINPGWPQNGGKKEMWDTYLYYEVRDPTIMLPTEVHLRYRWNEFKAVLIK